MATSEPVLEVDRSDSFTNGLLLNLWDMKTRGEMTDMAIIAANVRIPCHCNVMAAASEHFRELLKRPMKDSTKKEIELNFDEVCIQAVVEYCYTGKINIRLSAVKSYLRIVEYFQLKELKAKIDDFICEHVSLENCIGWYSTAKEFRLGALDEKCTDIIATNFSQVSEGADFLKLPAPILRECIKRSKGASESLEACASWVTLNILSRSKDFLELINHVQLDQCSPQAIEKVLQTWKTTWPNYDEVQQALRPFASVVPTVAAKPRRFTIMLLGGYTEANVLNRQIWKIDLKARTCRLFGKLDHKAVKYEAGYCSTAERLFVIGGSRALREKKFQRSSDCHALCVQDSRCEAWPKADEPLAEVVAECVGDHIYTFGGDSTDKAIYRLNLKTRKWSRCPDMPVGNKYPIIASIRHCVYWIFNTTEYNEKHKPSDRIVMYCLDTSTLTWTPLTPLPASIKSTWGAKAMSVGEDIYLVGGKKKLCARYSAQHIGWQILECPHVVHRFFPVVHMDGEIVLCGGIDEDDEPHDIIEVYNIAQNTWKVHSVRMPVGLDHHHCGVYDEETCMIVL